MTFVERNLLSAQRVKFIKISCQIVKDIIIWAILEKAKRGEKDEGNSNPRISHDTPVLTQICQDRLFVQTVYRLKRIKINPKYDFNFYFNPWSILGLLKGQTLILT